MFSSPFLVVSASIVEINVEPGNKVKFQENVTFSCNVTGNPRPSISWKKDGNLLTTNSSHLFQSNGTILQIINLTRGDTGNYTCIANNTLGNNSLTEELIVLCKYIQILYTPFAVHYQKTYYHKRQPQTL